MPTLPKTWLNDYDPQCLALVEGFFAIEPKLRTDDRVKDLAYQIQVIIENYFFDLEHPID